jgi:hypothetical protein
VFRKKEYNILITYSKPSSTHKVVIRKRLKTRRNKKQLMKRLKRKWSLQGIDTDIKILGETNAI